MARDFYARMQGIATDLLTRFNQGIIELGSVTPGTGPAHNPGPSTTLWHVIKGAARAARGSVLVEPGTLVKTGDLLLTTLVLAAVEPKPGDLIRFGGEDGQLWRVIRFDKVPATGTTAAWKIYIRRG